MAETSETSAALQDYDLPDFDLPVGVAVLAGAVAGSLGAFLFLTHRGSRVRQDLTARLDRALEGLDTVLTGWNDVQQRASALRGIADAARPSRGSSTGDPVS